MALWWRFILEAYYLRNYLESWPQKKHIHTCTNTHTHTHTRQIVRMAELPEAGNGGQLRRDCIFTLWKPWTGDLTLFFFFCLLKCSWFTVLYQFLVYSKVSQDINTHVYIYIHTHTQILFQILFHCSLLQDTENSSLCYTVGPRCLYSSYIIVYIC